MRSATSPPAMTARATTRAPGGFPCSIRSPPPSGRAWKRSWSIPRWRWRSPRGCPTLLRREDGAPPFPAAALLAATHEAGGAYYLITLADTLRENGYDPASQARRVAGWRKVVAHDPSLLPAWEALRDLGNQSSDM